MYNNFIDSLKYGNIYIYYIIENLKIMCSCEVSQEDFTKSCSWIKACLR